MGNCFMLRLVGVVVLIVMILCWLVLRVKVEGVNVREVKLFVSLILGREVGVRVLGEL